MEEAAREADTELSLLTVAEEPARDLETELTLLTVADNGDGACKYLPRGWSCPK